MKIACFIRGKKKKVFMVSVERISRKIWKIATTRWYKYGAECTIFSFFFLFFPIFEDVKENLEFRIFSKLKFSLTF